jgi:recombination protein RecR
MAKYPKALAEIIELLEKLPGVGPKTAARFAFFLLDQEDQYLYSLSTGIAKLKMELVACPQCFNFSADGICEICKDPKRDPGLVCVLASAPEITSIEKSGEFTGVYHVLRGLISPMDGIGPDNLTISTLLSRIKTNKIREIIMAVGSTVEAQATNLYISKIMKPLGIKVTELAYGLAHGSDIENADPVSISKAITNRREL